MGRPSDYSPEIADQICSLIADGKSMRTICKAEEMPCMQTVFRWLRSHPQFCEQYTQAKDDCADALVEEMLDIADDDSKDFGFKEVTDETGQSAQLFINKDNIQRARLRVDTRKFIAAKLKPKKYGDFQRTELTGKDGGPVEVKAIPDAELDAKLALLLGKVGASQSAGGEGASEAGAQN